MTIGENIRKIRMEKGMTVEQLAEAVCVKPPYISQIELYDKTHPARLFIAIAKALGCTANDLCPWEWR